MVDKKWLTAKKYYNKQFTRKLAWPKSILRIRWNLPLQRRISFLLCLMTGWRERWRTKDKHTNGECLSGNSLPFSSDTTFWSSETVLIHWEYKNGGQQVVVAQRRCLQEAWVHVAEMRGIRLGPRTTDNKELMRKLKITAIANSPLTFQEKQVLYYWLFIRKVYVASPLWNLMWSSANSA